jgi:hypothetical protein
MKKIAAIAIALILLITITTPVYALPELSAGNIDALDYTEQQGWKSLDNDITVHSSTDNFSEGYLEVAIEGGTVTDNLELSDNGSLSINGTSVYWNADRIGTIDSVKNGGAGVLRIDFASAIALPNADFETGDLTGWTAYTNYPGVNGQAWVESPADDPDVPDPLMAIWADPGEDFVDSDPLVDDYANGTQTATVQNITVNEGTYALKLAITGGVAEGYGTMHGPMVVSQTFSAAAGDNLSLTWYGMNDGDWYDVYGFVINDADDDVVWDNGESYQKLFHDVGDTTGGWVTTTATVSAGIAGSNLRFVFLAGNYDASGGQAIGSTMYVDGIELQLSIGNTAVTDSIVEFILENIQYRNTSDNPPAVRNYDVNLKASNGSTSTDSSQINITPVNDAPTAIALTNNHLAENMAAGTVTGNLSSTDPDSANFTYTITGGNTTAFSIEGAQLRTAESFDFEVLNTYSVNIQTDDGDNGTFTQTFSIAVDNIGDIIDPDVAVVTTPTNGSHFNAALAPSVFSGAVADAAGPETGGLNANTATL